MKVESLDQFKAQALSFARANGFHLGEITGNRFGERVACLYRSSGLGAGAITMCVALRIHRFEVCEDPR